MGQFLHCLEGWAGSGGFGFRRWLVSVSVGGLEQADGALGLEGEFSWVVVCWDGGDAEGDDGGLGVED